MTKPDEMAYYQQDELLNIDHHPPATDWLDTPVDFRPGSYIYPGKAKNLKRRVGSYFQPSRRFRIEQPKVAAMLDLIADFEVLEVRSDSEAILLEGRLIKEWKPKYNTDFTDDKRFLHVRVDLRTELPRLRLVLRVTLMSLLIRMSTRSCQRPTRPAGVQMRMAVVNTCSMTFSLAAVLRS